jgi:8-oxo-dGTP diphosphatase
MNNFEFEHNGEKLWYSRSLACNIGVFRINNDEYEVLACKRGQGCEFNKGLWNIPGGFIDFNENAAQCAVRELFEETGIKISEKKVKFYKLSTNPRGVRQTMNASHYAFFDKEETLNWVFTTEFSENEETEEIKWIPMSELKNYKWTNNQTSLINSMCEKIKVINSMCEKIKETNK